jgi:hypothetical protein
MQPHLFQSEQGRIVNDTNAIGGFCGVHFDKLFSMTYTSC